jgi:hypothetical protein
VALAARHMNHTNRIRSGFNVVEFTAKAADGLAVADADFEMRRGLIELLDVQGTLAVENSDKVVYVLRVRHDSGWCKCRVRPIQLERRIYCATRLLVLSLAAKVQCPRWMVGFRSGAV